MDAATIKKKLKNIKNYHGFIFAKDISNRTLKDGYFAVNLDRSKPLNGTHWVGMAVDVDKKTIFYFDSFGASPPEELLGLKRSGYKIFYSSRQHQKATETNCGDWVIRFIQFMNKNKNNFQKFLFSLI